MSLECNSSSMPIQHRSGLSKVLPLSWNSLYYLLTIFSLPLLECSNSGTCLQAQIVYLLHPLYSREFPQSFLLDLPHFHFQQSWLVFLHISISCLISLPCLASSTLFHPAVCVPHHELIFLFEHRCSYSFSVLCESTEFTLTDAITEELGTFGGVMLHWFSCF